MTTKYCMSLHDRFGFASMARAQMPAAMGALAEVPVCCDVQILSGRSLASWSTVAILASWPGVPEEKVDAKVEEHCSRYQGLKPPWLAEEIDKVKIEFV
jgi:hypothetical protein